MKNLEIVIDTLNGYSDNNEKLIRSGKLGDPKKFNDLLAKTIKIYEEICDIEVYAKLDEEVSEVEDALTDGNIEGTVDELGDVTYLIHRYIMTCDESDRDVWMYENDLWIFMEDTLKYCSRLDIDMTEEDLMYAILFSMYKKMVAVELSYEYEKTKVEKGKRLQYVDFKKTRLYYEENMSKRSQDEIMNMFYDVKLVFAPSIKKINIIKKTPLVKICI